jgi:hypothetical protein
MDAAEAIVVRAPVSFRAACALSSPCPAQPSALLCSLVRTAAQPLALATGSRPSEGVRPNPQRQAERSASHTPIPPSALLSFLLVLPALAPFSDTKAAPLFGRQKENASRHACETYSYRMSNLVVAACVSCPEVVRSLFRPPCLSAPAAVAGGTAQRAEET